LIEFVIESNCYVFSVFMLLALQLLPIALKLLTVML